MGLSVVGVGLIGLSIIYFAFHGDVNFLTIIPAFGFGASGVALFARVGGGIYTKAADAGSDLAGKVKTPVSRKMTRAMPRLSLTSLAITSAMLQVAAVTCMRVMLSP